MKKASQKVRHFTLDIMLAKLNLKSNIDLKSIRTAM
jgi:hypothetical protein